MDVVGERKERRVARANEVDSTAGTRSESAAVLAHVDRMTADVAAAALHSYRIDAVVVTDPSAGNAKAPVSRSAPAHAVVVRPEELALARDVLRRSASNLPPEFRDDDIEAWSAERAATHRRGAEPMVRAGAIAVAAFVLAVLLVAGVVAALT